MKREDQRRLDRVERDIRAFVASIERTEREVRAISEAGRAMASIPTAPIIPGPRTIATRCCPAVPETLHLYRDFDNSNNYQYITDITYDPAYGYWREGTYGFRLVPRGAGACFDIQWVTLSQPAGGRCSPFRFGANFGAFLANVLITESDTPDF